MNCNDECSFLTKFHISNIPYYGKFSFNTNVKDLFSIDLLGQEKCWSGNLSRDSVKTFSENLDETEEQYFTNVIAALKRKEASYVIDLTPDKEHSNLLKLVWKRKIPKGFLIHGYVTLQKGEQSTINRDTIIDFLLNKHEELESIIEDYKKKNELLVHDFTKCRSEFESLVDIKTTLEENLYGKFIQILNSKKRRIRLLEDQLNNVDESTCVNKDGD